VLERWREDGMLALLGLASVKLIVHLAMAGRCGFHRDALYYLAAGRHPSFGYVDYPPITAGVARAVDLGVRAFAPAGCGSGRPWPAP
jgi:hypothetical protein